MRVIVGLNVRVRPEGKLTWPSALLQRQTVDARRLGMLRVLRGRRFGNVKDLSPVPFVAMDVSRDALTALQRSADVANIAEDTLLELERRSAGVTSNENLNDWWDLYQTHTDTAWNNGYDGRGQTIGVLDTGTQAGHPWLAGKVVREACYAYITAGSTSGGCPNGSYSQTGAGAAQPCTYHALCGHGTHVAATAAGTYGVARRANLIAVQVFHRDPATGEPRAWSSDLLWGLKYVYDQRGSYSIASVNLSLGGGQWTGYCDGYDSAGRLAGDREQREHVLLDRLSARGRDRDGHLVGQQQLHERDRRSGVQLQRDQRRQHHARHVRLRRGVLRQQLRRQADRLEHLERPLRPGAGHPRLLGPARPTARAAGPEPRWPRPTSPARSPRSSSSGPGRPSARR